VGLNGKLYVIGGFVEGWTPTDEVHEYDPASDRWQRLAALPTTRGALAAAALDGKIHAVGGIGWCSRNTPAHEVYDPAANRWTGLAYVPKARDHLAVAATARSGVAAAVLEGRIFVFGGDLRSMHRLLVPKKTGRKSVEPGAGFGGLAVHVPNDITVIASLRRRRRRRRQQEARLGSRHCPAIP
jgi:N-acetylneuraminic acid mutarotase